jgi:5-methylcytosine-specific restriction enzyme subunit McrC
MRTERVTLVEYDEPKAILHELATTLQVDPDLLRSQFYAAGDRAAGILGLSANPFFINGNSVRVADIAGLIRISPRIELEIAPKFLGGLWSRWREDFFFLCMLSRHGKLLANERLSADSGNSEDLATLVARTMVSMFWDNYRRPLRTYRREKVLDFVIDGDVEPDMIFLPNSEGYPQEIVSFDRRNLFNSVILSAVSSLLPQVRDPQTKKQLTRVGDVLTPQLPLRKYGAKRVPSRAKRWQALYDLAVDVLNGFSANFQSGDLRAPGFVLNTWKIWEDLLTVALRLGIGSSKIGAQRSIALGLRSSFNQSSTLVTRTAWVTPDVAITISGGTKLLIDAKYKGRSNERKGRVSEADLYEALAFASAAGVQQVVLLYPAVPRNDKPVETGKTEIFERIAVKDIVIFGMEVDVRGVSQSGSMHAFARNLALSVAPMMKM